MAQIFRLRLAWDIDRANSLAMITWSWALLPAMKAPWLGDIHLWRIRHKRYSRILEMILYWMLQRPIGLKSVSLLAFGLLGMWWNWINWYLAKVTMSEKGRDKSQQIFFFYQGPKFLVESRIVSIRPWGFVSVDGEHRPSKLFLIGNLKDARIIVLSQNGL